MAADEELIGAGVWGGGWGGRVECVVGKDKSVIYCGFWCLKMCLEKKGRGLELGRTSLSEVQTVDREFVSRAAGVTSS